ncbi:alpha/beta-hydrolase [Xylariomycetidae sp. FL0641]|nr:alpha/beta-hydrolase [Xylariomycetidae sp. FL0641]
MPKLSLPSKPDAPLAYELYEGDAASSLLVVFLNGLGLPQAAWKPTIDLLRQSDLSPQPWLLTYDRYGQGASARDPRERRPGREPGYAHTLDDVTDDLGELLRTACPASRRARVVFANNSIGAHVARRYADRYPSTVEGILFLDANPANASYERLWPDPRAPAFDFAALGLPQDATATPDAYAAAYARMTRLFAADARNAEGFDRRQIPTLLPAASEPKLRGAGGRGGPWITVVGHELATFARQEHESLGVPLGLAEKYTQPMWDAYNKGLCELTDPDRAKGPLVAPGAGHFVQKDNPAFVAEQLVDLIMKVESER